MSETMPGGNKRGHIDAKPCSTPGTAHRLHTGYRSPRPLHPAACNGAARDLPDHIC